MLLIASRTGRGVTYASLLTAGAEACRCVRPCEGAPRRGGRKSAMQDTPSARHTAGSIGRLQQRRPALRGPAKQVLLSHPGRPNNEA